MARVTLLILTFCVCATIEPATAALLWVALSTPMKKIRWLLLPEIVLPLPLTVSEFRIGDRGPDSVTLVSILMVTAEDCALA